jgi:dienelactone hydrolase
MQDPNSAVVSAQTLLKTSGAPALYARAVSGSAAARRSARLRGVAALLLLGSGLLGCTMKNPDYCTEPGQADCESRPDLTMPTDPPDLADSTADLSTSGGGDLAQAPDLSMAQPLDPGVPGPRKVVSFDLKIPVGVARSVDVTVFGPTTDGKEITMMGAPFPLVVISPGFTLDRKLFSNYAARLASYGIAAVLQKSSSEFNHATYRDETRDLISWLYNPTNSTGDRVKDRFDKNKLGMAGHSLGGKISLLVAAQDTRVKAVLGIDPVDANNPAAIPELSKIKLPTGVPLVLLGETISKSGGMPCTPTAGNFEAIYAKANAPAVSITFKDAAHNDFVDNFMSCTFCGVCPGGTAPKDRTNRLAVKYTAAYFLWALAGDARAAAYLTGAEFLKDVTAGYVTSLTK